MAIIAIIDVASVGAHRILDLHIMPLYNGNCRIALLMAKWLILVARQYPREIGPYSFYLDRYFMSTIYS